MLLKSKELILMLKGIVRKVRKDSLIQFIKFGMVGLTNTLLNWLIYYILISLGVFYIIAYIVGFIISILNSYILNTFFVFKKDNRSHMVSLFKMTIAYSFTMILGSGLLFLLIDIFSISQLIAPVIVLLLTVPINFLINKYWALS